MATKETTQADEALAAQEAAELEPLLGGRDVVT
jgi:hypothetical protein